MKRVLTIIIIVVIASGFSGIKKTAVPGANQIKLYKHLIEGKSVAIVANQTSMVGQTHLVDYLLNKNIDIKVIFAPEHGYRELASDGERIKDGTDPATGISLKSLYGTRRKPAPEDLNGIDVVIFDIQDVGVRFYTYISTLHYVMEACAENNVKCIVLDRPNPNGFYFDGNIADTAYHSFVAMHPVPIVHGMTVGEYAQMINGEGWLENGVKCDLTVIKCKKYTYKTFYELPVKPSPNLPNQTSVYLYPSLCFFEGTNISVGRGTSFPFQVYGSPKLPDNGFSFTPESVPGSVNPPLLGVKCYGIDLRNAIYDKLVPSPKINLGWVIDAYRSYPEKDKFFTSYFDRLAAGPTLREQIQKGMSSDEIRATWIEGLEKFGKIREKYLLYK
ncbi:MAG: DUF1343 domain-containing protein [Bacteroidales bacterium]|nr:DUF1343 domain-containing protein [Bacteroidales bacterium]